jgi:hypothetical protein
MTACRQAQTLKLSELSGSSSESACMAPLRCGGVADSALSGDKPWVNAPMHRNKQAAGRQLLLLVRVGGGTDQRIALVCANMTPHELVCLIHAYLLKAF